MPGAEELPSRRIAERRATPGRGWRVCGAFHAVAEHHAGQDVEGGERVVVPWRL
jgi:hypothetical protein